MTFIIAIQLEDSIIVAADKRYIRAEDNHYAPCEEDGSKLYVWQQGVITGAGEAYTIHNAIEFFIKTTNANIQSLSDCLKKSKQIRTDSVGHHFQIQTSKLLYSIYDPNVGAQLYTIQADDDQNNNDEVAKLDLNEILIWLYNPDISDITNELKQLYSTLRNLSSFDRTIDWINYYLQQFCMIFKKQRIQDQMMSASFNVFFQTKDEYFMADLDNDMAFEPLCLEPHSKNL